MFQTFIKLDHVEALKYELQYKNIDGDEQDLTFQRFYGNMLPEKDKDEKYLGLC